MNSSGEVDQAVTEICEKISLPLLRPIFMFEFTWFTPRERKQYEPKGVTGEWGEFFNDVHLDLGCLGFDQLCVEHPLTSGLKTVSDADSDIDLLRRCGAISRTVGCGLHDFEQLRHG